MKRSYQGMAELEHRLQEQNQSKLNESKHEEEHRTNIYPPKSSLNSSSNPLHLTRLQELETSYRMWEHPDPERAARMREQELLKEERIQPRKVLTAFEKVRNTFYRFGHQDPDNAAVEFLKREQKREEERKQEREHAKVRESAKRLHEIFGKMEEICDKLIAEKIPMIEKLQKSDLKEIQQFYRKEFPKAKAIAQQGKLHPALTELSTARRWITEFVIPNYYQIIQQFVQYKQGLNFELDSKIVSQFVQGYYLLLIKDLLGMDAQFAQLKLARTKSQDTQYQAVVQMIGLLEPMLPQSAKKFLEILGKNPENIGRFSVSDFSVKNSARRLEQYLNSLILEIEALISKNRKMHFDDKELNDILSALKQKAREFKSVLKRAPEMEACESIFEFFDGYFEEIYNSAQILEHIKSIRQREEKEISEPSVLIKQAVGQRQVEEKEREKDQEGTVETTAAGPKTHRSSLEGSSEGSPEDLIPGTIQSTPLQLSNSEEQQYAKDLQLSLQAFRQQKSEELARYKETVQLLRNEKEIQKRRARLQLLESKPESETKEWNESGLFSDHDQKMPNEEAQQLLCIAKAIKPHRDVLDRLTKKPMLGFSNKVTLDECLNLVARIPGAQTSKSPHFKIVLPNTYLNWGFEPDITTTSVINLSELPIVTGGSFNLHGLDHVSGELPDVARKQWLDAFVKAGIISLRLERAEELLMNISATPLDKSSIRAAR